MNIAIAGYGVEGEANYRYFRHLGDVTIVDERSTPKAELPQGAPTLLGPGVFERLQGFDMVVRTAGLAPRKIATDGKIWSATNEFFAKCPAPIIGVTGTKGKGTTASLIASILRAAGKTVHLVGNIGTPALDALPQITASDIVVYELSSFQLWDLERSPHVAIILLIEPDHLDVHQNFEEYVEAKANIRRHQTSADACFYHPTNTFSERIAHSATPLTAARRYGVRDDGAVYVENSWFMCEGRRLCQTSELQIAGTYNLENACAAISAALLYTDDRAAIASGLRSFPGLPHRLKFIAEVNGVKYYDNSIGTTPGSAIATLHSFMEPMIILLGGSDKGADYGALLETARDTDTTIIGMGQTGRGIVDLARQDFGMDGRARYLEGRMDSIIPTVAQQAKAGSVVVLSPACASFDQYASYSDRGDQFIKAVEDLRRAQRNR